MLGNFTNSEFRCGNKWKFLLTADNLRTRPKVTEEKEKEKEKEKGGAK